MFVAVNMELARKDLARAIRFALREETLIDMIKALNRRPDYEKFLVYYIS